MSFLKKITNKFTNIGKANRKDARTNSIEDSRTEEENRIENLKELILMHCMLNAKEISIEESHSINGKGALGMSSGDNNKLGASGEGAHSKNRKIVIRNHEKQDTGD